MSPLKCAPRLSFTTKDLNVFFNFILQSVFYRVRSLKAILPLLISIKLKQAIFFVSFVSQQSKRCPRCC